MSRNRRMNWEHRAAEEKQRETVTHGQTYFRPAPVNQGYYLGYVKYETTCEECGIEIIQGERAWRKKDTRWRHLHETCLK